MKPVIFSGCFGWLHEGCSARGIVMCAAFGHENMVAHRGWRLLAEKLAARGFHVLRFDYPGTGDSSGSEDDPDRLAAWRSSIIAAVYYLQSVSETEEVILIGLRLGATLALLAAEDLHQVSGVAGLAPVFSGKTYLRELRLRSNSWKEAHLIEVTQQSVRSMEVLGERLGEETIAELSELNLCRLKVSNKTTLIVGFDEDILSSCVSDQLRKQGCNPLFKEFHGYFDYLEDSISSVIPWAEFNVVIDWCDQFILRSRTPTKPSQTTKLDNLSLFLPEAAETAVRFGGKQHLFGILCCPTEVKCRPEQPVIMLNTGFGRHIGDGRVFTLLARRLAAEGITSLRMNLAGFGDSNSVGDDGANPYAANTFEDVKEAIDYLEHIGYRNPVVVGVCSGAFTAFRSAIEDRRISGVILVNIQTFLQKQGLSLKVQIRQQRRPIEFYLRAITRLNTWRRLFHGEFSAGSIFLGLCQRPLSAVKLSLCLNFERLSGQQVKMGQVSRWFEQLNARGVKINLFYSNGDPGLTELALWFGRGRRRLKRLQNVYVDVLSDADHALLDYKAKLKFMEIVLDLMKS